MKILKKDLISEEVEFDLNEVSELVKEFLLPLLAVRSIITFSGPLGVGKTTIIKEFLRQSGIEGVVDSPTFGYVKSYKSQKWGLFNHFDLYRFSTPDDFINAGFDEYLNRSEGVVLIEWPEVIGVLLKAEQLSKDIYTINLKYSSNDCLHKRVLTLKKNH